MSPKGHKLAVTLTAMLLLAIALFAAFILIPAWQARDRASRLLACLRYFHPAITTEAEARARLKPFYRYEHSDVRQEGDKQVQESSYSFFNFAEPLYKVVNALPVSLAQQITLPWTMIEVTLGYQDGVLRYVHIVEMQEDSPGAPHPNSVSTTIISSRFDQGVPSLTTSDFTGYSVRSQSTGRTDANDNWTSFSCCHARFITLDERATPVQLAESLNFQLHCLTSWRRCKDDRQILP